VRVEGEEPARARDGVVVHHPLQAFDPRNFEPGRLTGVEPWSFDHVTLAGARAIRSGSSEPAPFLGGPLPAKEGARVVDLDDLVRFVQHPVRAFLRQRLGISVGDFSTELGEAIPLELDALEKWGIGERFTAARLAGATADACAAAERARGDLPPGALADQVLAAIGETAECLVTEASNAVGNGTDVDSLEVTVRLDDGRLLVGTVPGVLGTVVRSVSYSRVGPKHRLAAWVRFLALSASRPADGISVVTVGKARAGASRSRRVTVSTFTPCAEDPGSTAATARRHLHELVAVYDRGMREPLPIACGTSAAWAAALARGKDGIAAATGVWESGKFAGEDKDQEHQLVLGGVVPFERLLDAPPGPDEEGPGWEAAETTRFGRYARRLWSGLLDTEELVDR
jgi:exodeoxyribonuclease V gamma subunit